MKLFSIFMLAFTLGTYASGYSQKQLVTLDLKQCDINTLFQEIWKQTGLRFVYNEQDITGLNNLNIKAKQQQVDKVLDGVFRNSPYQCSYESDVIYVIPRPDAPQKQKEMVTLSGNVSDKNGNPLPGVTVFLGNSDIGTSTDIYGNYSLQLVKGVETPITYSFIGMKTVIFPFKATENTHHNVVLEEDNVKLQDVVVIGYGSKSKKDITSSISSVKAEELEKSANGTATFDNMLGGAVKGLLVTQSTGEPGSRAIVNIRGITSPVSGSSNEPLYVIDGVPFFVEHTDMNPLLAISPNDIESIDVLKDAAATSIYGSRGANGVIIVKTKSGRRNEKMKISLGYTLSIGNPVKRYNALNTAQFKTLQELIIKNDIAAINSGINNAYDMGIDAMALVSYDENGQMVYEGLNEEGFGTADTDWTQVTRNKNALTHQYNLNMRGGGEKSNYMFSFNAIDQEGLYIRDDMQTYSTRLSIDSDISQRFKGGATLAYTFSKRFSGVSGESFNMGYPVEWTARPDIAPYDENGELTRYDKYYYGVLFPTPLGERQNNNTTQTTQFMGNSYLEYKILDNLKIRGDINLALFEGKNSLFMPVATLPITPGFEESSSSMLFDTRYKNANTSINFRADYNFSRNGHDFTAMVGYGWDRLFNENLLQAYNDFPDDEYLNNIGSAATWMSADESKVKSGLNSVYARVSYNYQEKYLAEANFRSDASSRFGPGNRRAYFPSLSLGWRMNKENFMSEVSQVNDLKLRFSVGQTGSTNISDFLYRQFYVSSDSYEGLPAIKPSTLPNQDIKWEMTTEYNGGIDFSFFNYRLFGSIDAYYRYTDGALSPSPLPFESGSSSFYSNIIDLSNKGMEVEIGGDIIRTDAVTWTSKFNISFNRNKIEKLNGATLNSFQTDFYNEGQPAGTLKGYLVEKIFQQGDEKEIENLNATAQEKGKAYYWQAATSVGDYKFKDVDNNGYIDENDRVIIATPEPKFFGGFYNSIHYKGLNLSLMFQFSKGAQSLYNNLRTDAFTSLGTSICPELFGNTWTPENPGARYARQVSNDPSRNSQTSDRYVFETSYLRLKNISLSYSLPSHLLQKINIQSATVFASLSNIWTLTKWPGIDPELIGNLDITNQTSNKDPYPLSKNFSLGLKIEF